MTSTFDLKLFIQSCQKCERTDGSLSTDHYLFICNELLVLCRSLGLGPAVKDAEKAVKDLEIRRVMGAGCYYNSLRLMLQYEADNNLSERSTRMREGTSRIRSGTSALVDLHRAVDFLVQFFSALKKAVSTGAKFQAKWRIQVYKDTLGQHQETLTQHAAKLALIRTSGKREILSKLNQSCDNKQTTCANALSNLLDALLPVHSKISSAFAEVFRDEVTETATDFFGDSEIIGNGKVK